MQLFFRSRSRFCNCFFYRYGLYRFFSRNGFFSYRFSCFFSRNGFFSYRFSCFFSRNGFFSYRFGNRFNSLFRSRFCCFFCYCNLFSRFCNSFYSLLGVGFFVAIQFYPFFVMVTFSKISFTSMSIPPFNWGTQAISSAKISPQI